ncbi:MAG: hypothetical protein IPG92_17760 [Flavobacteriales bacterium]|nr:hypothetical protein [Flavobacteriales bacterium]
MSTAHSLLLSSVAILVSCSNNMGQPTGGEGSEAIATGDVGAEQQPGKFTEGKDYVVLERVRFMDNTGFEQPAEAFSILLPKGWKHEGGVVWKGLNECRGEMISGKWSVSSPDGAISYTVLPNHSWASASDPMMMQSMQMQAQQGGCEVGGPMDASNYLSEVMGPRVLQGARITEVKVNTGVQQEMERSAAKTKAAFEQWGGQAQLMPSAVTARLNWNDGSEGIALVSVLNVINVMQNAYTGEMQQLTNSNASERSILRFPAARRDEAERVLATIKSSYRTNPQWQEAVNGYFAQLRNNADRMHHQRMAAIDAQTAANTRAHNQRMADIQSQGAANTARHNDRMGAMDQQMRSWEQQQSSQDRQHTQFVKAIREVETYNDGSNGRVELTSGYNHAWSRGDGSYILTNSPNFDPSSVLQDQAWKQMEQVP